jgi:hypothetical protein
MKSKAGIWVLGGCRAVASPEKIAGVTHENLVKISLDGSLSSLVSLKFT